jgi:hypothetical protein
VNVGLYPVPAPDDAYPLFFLQPLHLKHSMENPCAARLQQVLPFEPPKHAVKRECHCTTAGLAHEHPEPSVVSSQHLTRLLPVAIPTPTICSRISTTENRRRDFLLRSSYENYLGMRAVDRCTTRSKRSYVGCEGRTKLKSDM